MNMVIPLNNYKPLASKKYFLSANVIIFLHRRWCKGEYQSTLK